MRRNSFYIRISFGIYTFLVSAVGCGRGETGVDFLHELKKQCVLVGLGEGGDMGHALFDYLTIFLFFLKVEYDGLLLHYGNFLIAECNAILLVFVQRFRDVFQELAEFLNRAVCFLIVAELATRDSVRQIITAVFGKRYDVIYGHIIKLYLFAAISAMTIVFIEYISAVHILFYLLGVKKLCLFIIISYNE